MSQTPDLCMTNALLYLLGYTGAERRIMNFAGATQVRTGEISASST
ncbi:MAG: hypothetical protein ACOH2I_11455 [Pseudomonas sp.]